MKNLKGLLKEKKKVNNKLDTTHPKKKDEERIVL